MKRLDKFILKSFLGPFVATLLIVIFILMMQFLWLYIDELVGKGLSFRIIAEFMLWGGCTTLPLSLPLATLLASMMTMGQMAEHNELMAMKAQGISLMRVLSPLIGAAMLIAIGAFFTGNDLVPLAFNKIYTLRDDIGRTKNEIKIPPGVFYDGLDGYVLRVDAQDKDSGMMYGVMVYDHTKGKGNEALTMADSSMIRMSKAKDYLTFTLYNGTNYQETDHYVDKDSTRQMQKVEFAKQELVIPLKNYSFKKSDSTRFGDQIKTKGYTELKYNQDSLGRKVEECRARNYRELLRSGSFLQVRELDTARRRGLVSLYDDENFLVWKEKMRERDCIGTAVENARTLQNLVKVYSNNSYEFLYYKRRTDVELLKKLAQAIACFIFFFIGAPLGSIIRKGGLGVGAIVSVLFFVLYWVVDISGIKLANDGHTAPFIGVFVSGVVLAPIGAYLTWQASHDAKLFNFESLGIWFRKVRSRIAGLFHRTRIVYMGTPEFAVAPLEAILRQDRKYKVVGVVTVADKPSGRGLKVNESAVKKYAVAHGIPVLQPVKLKDPEFLSSLAALKADLFVVVAFRMLPEEVWKMPKLGTFNLHAALLPQYRGAAPINWAVINGEKMTGVTTFMIDKDIDTGGIMLRQECRIGPEDTAGDVHDALMGIGADLVLQTVQGIVEHNMETRVQQSFIQGSEELHPAPKLTRELCHIDWNDTSAHIHNLIRGLSPYPTAFTEITREGSDPLQLKIFKAKVSDMQLPAGTIASDGKTWLNIGTADGSISVEDLQLSGKRRMNVHDFLLGFRNPEEWGTTEGTSTRITKA